MGFCLTVAESKELNAKGGFGIKVIDGGVSHTTGNENHNTVKFSRLFVIHSCFYSSRITKESGAMLEAN